MINFFSTVFNSRAYPPSVCGPNEGDVIQQCVGCDAECLYSCGSLAEATPGGGGNNCDSCDDSCTLACSGKCSSFVSAILGK